MALPQSPQQVTLTATFPTLIGLGHTMRQLSQWRRVKQIEHREILTNFNNHHEQ
jgi:hypothetical protein